MAFSLPSEVANGNNKRDFAEISSAEVIPGTLEPPQKNIDEKKQSQALHRQILADLLHTRPQGYKSFILLPIISHPAVKDAITIAYASFFGEQADAGVRPQPVEIVRELLEKWSNEFTDVEGPKGSKRIRISDILQDSDNSFPVLDNAQVPQVPEPSAGAASRQETEKGYSQSVLPNSGVQRQPPVDSSTLEGTNGSKQAENPTSTVLESIGLKARIPSIALKYPPALAPLQGWTSTWFERITKITDPNKPKHAANRIRTDVFELRGRVKEDSPSRTKIEVFKILFYIAYHLNEIWRSRFDSTIEPLMKAMADIALLMQKMDRDELPIIWGKTWRDDMKRFVDRAGPQWSTSKVEFNMEDILGMLS
jgi:hypothetical protein